LRERALLQEMPAPPEEAEEERPPEFEALVDEQELEHRGGG
jgi:hypothetical protein